MTSPASEALSVMDNALQPDCSVPSDRSRQSNRMGWGNFAGAPSCVMQLELGKSQDSPVAHGLARDADVAPIREPKMPWIPRNPLP